MESGKDAIPGGQIEDRIYTVRSKRVMLDADLARLYGVTTKRLNEQVRRNADRFPEDFAFKLTDQEVTNLKSQIATSSEASRGHGGRRYQPWVFTEHGAIMAASVLNTPRAVEVSVFVVRAFVKLRELSATHKELGQKLDELERKVSGHDQAIAGLINAIRELMTPPEPKKKRPIGFGQWDEK
ncbi:MAG: ORF6N domain-containing protein [Gammaproteobacteria bacterium]|nr:ORF6N domain-containing protein [Gammaproteobacteria bacterium]